MKSNCLWFAASAAMLATSVFAAGCASSSSELSDLPDGGPSEADGGAVADANRAPDAATGTPDAAPQNSQVHLVAAGVTTGVSVVMSVQGAVQSMTVSADGAFAFPAQLPAGVPYDLELGTGQPCLLDRHSGTVGVDAPVQLTCDGVAALADIRIDSLAGLSPTFDSETLEYTTELTSLVENLEISAQVANGNATVSVAGGPAAATVETSIGLATTSSITLLVAHPSGLARTYTLTRPADTVLAERHKQTEDTPVDGNFFGEAVAASDGFLAIGSVHTKDGNGVDTGAVFVYRYGMGGLALETILRSANPHTYARFGQTIAMSNQTLVVGVPGDSSAGAGINPSLGGGASLLRSGAVEVFQRQADGTWPRIARIKSAQPKAEESYGTAVGLGGDTIVVGVPSNDSPTQLSTTPGTTYIDVGNAYVYRINGTIVSGETLIRPVQLRNSHQFGHSVAVDGGTIVIGAPGDRSQTATPGDTTAAASGAAWVYQFHNNAWRWTAFLKATTPEANAKFGTSVAIDGDAIAVGEPGASGVPLTAGAPLPNAVGAVSLYRRVAGQWYPVDELNPGPQRYPIAFGSSLALRGDRLAVGAWLAWSSGSGVDPVSYGPLLFQSGAAYLFDTESLALLHVIKASDPTESAYFGRALALASHGLAVSAPAANGEIESPGPGAVYLFQ